MPPAPLSDITSMDVHPYTPHHFQSSLSQKRSRDEVEAAMPLLNLNVDVGDLVTSQRSKEEASTLPAISLPVLPPLKAMFFSNPKLPQPYPTLFSLQTAKEERMIQLSGRESLSSYPLQMPHPHSTFYEENVLLNRRSMGFTSVIRPVPLIHDDSYVVCQPYYVPSQFQRSFPVYQPPHTGQIVLPNSQRPYVGVSRLSDVKQASSVQSSSPDTKSQNQTSGVLRRRSMYRPSRRMDLKCEFCGRSESPEWRRGPSGPNSLCNACGIKYNKRRKTSASSADSSKEAKSNENAPSLTEERSKQNESTTDTNGAQTSSDKSEISSNSLSPTLTKILNKNYESKD